MFKVLVIVVSLWAVLFAARAEANVGDREKVTLTSVTQNAAQQSATANASMYVGNEFVEKVFQGQISFHTEAISASINFKNLFQMQAYVVDQFCDPSLASYSTRVFIYYQSPTAADSGTIGLPPGAPEKIRSVSGEFMSNSSPYPQVFSVNCDR